jgi:predicted metal-binding protein
LRTAVLLTFLNKEPKTVPTSAPVTSVRALNSKGGFDMAEKTKIGIMLCDQHCVQTQCHGIKCFRALNNREGAFEDYKDKDLELVSYVTCTGCPGGAVGNKVLAEMKKLGVKIVFLSSGAVCGFPPCPYIGYLRDLTEKSFGMKMVVGTHPIPTTFWEWHRAAGSWDSPEWQEYIKPTTTDEKTREAYINII